MKFSKFILIALTILITSAASAFAQAPDAKGLSLIDGERFVEAADYIKKGMESDPKNPGWNYLDGLLHYVLEEYPAASESFKAGIDVKSKYPYNHIGLARTYNMLKKTDERDQVIEKIKALNKKNNAEINLELTTVLTEAERGEEAKLILYKLRDEIPDNVDVWRKLAEYYEFRKVDELAEKNYERVLEKDANDVKAMLALGKIYINKREFEKGLGMFNKAIKLDPTLAPAYKERGELFRRWGSATSNEAKKAELFKQATADYEKYIGMLPGDTRAQYRYAQFLYLSGDYEKAIEELNKAQTDSYVKTRLLGYSLIGIGKLAEGKAKLDDYFKRVPEEKIIKEDYEALGTYYMGQQDYEKAITNYRKMLEIEAEQTPDNARDADDYFEKMAKDFKEAKDYKSEMVFRQNMLKEKEANGIEIPYQRYFNLGFAAYRAKDYEAARDAFNKVTELKSDFEGGWYWRGSCEYKLTGGNEAEGWPIAPFYKKVVDLLKDKPVADLKKSEKSHLQTASVYMAFATFNAGQVSDPTPEDLDCEGAMIYVNKVLELDAANTQISSINEYCNQ